VVLVGHSSSGAVITGAADRAPAQIAVVVYLDAFVPEDGQAVLDLISPERQQMMQALVRRKAMGGSCRVSHRRRGRQSCATCGV
jgi:pimeloyl-ACP methyl ester carboxylesterase